MESSHLNSLDQAVPALSAVLSGLLAPADDGPGLALIGNESLVALLSAADRLVSLAEAARAALIREVEQRDATHEVAACPIAEWLRRDHGHTGPKARAIVKDAVRVGRFAALTAAHGAGTVSTGQVGAIARMLAELPDDLASAEVAAATATMIGFAAEHDPVELSRLGWRLLETIAPERADEIIADQLAREEKRAATRRGLRLFPTHHGEWILRGSFSDTEGEELQAILSAYADSAWSKAADDTTSAPTPKDTLAADALMTIVRAHQTRGEGPVHGGDRPRVTLIIPLASLIAGLGQMALTGGSFLSAAEARRLACDADLIPAVLDAHGVPLDVGREKRLVTPDIRVALLLRDRGCAFPGCDRPPAACEAHHIIPWWAGGPTSLDNLVLLCPTTTAGSNPAADRPTTRTTPPGGPFASAPTDSPKSFHPPAGTPTADPDATPVTPRCATEGPRLPMGPAYRDHMHLLNPGPELADALEPYLRVDRSRRVGECWVAAHMVGGLDGSAAIAGRVGSLSTGPDAALFRRMRQIADVVLVGAETVRREGYGPVRLSAEAQEARVAEGRVANPPLAIVSRSLDLPWASRAFSDAPADARTLVVTCASADPERVEAAREVADVVIAGEDRVKPARAMAELAGVGHGVVLCEGGPRWLGEIVAADLLDELLLSISPVMGGDPLPVSVTPAGAPLRRLALHQVLREDDTLFLRFERGEVDAHG